jgi:hypothetical protein
MTKKTVIFACNIHGDTLKCNWSYVTGTKFAFFKCDKLQQTREDEPEETDSTGGDR